MATETQQLSEQGYVLASEVKRLINFVIDMVIISTVLYLLAPDAILDMTTEGQVLLVVGMFLYYFLFETLFQRTPAKFITRTKVVSLNGSKPSVSIIALRTLCRFVPFDAISSIGTPKGNRTWWHDRWVKTRVVNTSTGALRQIDDTRAVEPLTAPLKEAEETTTGPTPDISELNYMQLKLYNSLNDAETAYNQVLSKRSEITIKSHMELRKAKSSGVFPVWLVFLR